MRTVRTRAQVALIVTLMAGTVAADAAERDTAVFTLDAEQRRLSDTLENSLATQLAGWAAQCRIEPGGAIFVLTCPARAAAAPAEAAAEHDPGRPPTAPADAVDGFVATLALFRDLEETVYLAGCPVPLLPTAEGSAENSPAATGARFDPDDLRDCGRLEPGLTFSTQLEHDRLRIVTRGRQLEMQIFEVREKSRTAGTPYVPEPSRRLPDAGPDTRRAPKGLEPQNPPRWEPPGAAAASSGKPSSPKLAGVEPAQTSLRAGRLTIECNSRQAFVLIDDAYVGSCPATFPLLAGPHTVVVRTPGKRDQIRELRIEAGESRRIRIR